MIKFSFAAKHAGDQTQKTEPAQQEADAEKAEPTDGDQSLLATLPLVQKIVRKKLRQTRASERSDLTQSIALRLWNWRTRYREKSEAMTAEEWERFAARAAYNELHRYFARGVPENESLDKAMEIAAPENLVGQAKAELQSLARFLWRQICQLSLRQRRALLLNCRRTVVYLLTGGVTDEELITNLEFPPDEWFEIKDRLPLSDDEICALAKKIGGHGNLQSTVNSIKKARHEARARLQQKTKR